MGCYNCSNNASNNCDNLIYNLVTSMEPQFVKNIIYDCFK